GSERLLEGERLARQGDGRGDGGIERRGDDGDHRLDGGIGDERRPLVVEAAAEGARLLAAPGRVPPAERGESELRHVGADVMQVALPVLAGTDQADGEPPHDLAGAAQPASEAAMRGSRLRSRRSPSPAAPQRSRYSPSAPANQRRAKAAPRARAAGAREPAASRTRGSRNSGVPAMPSTVCSLRSR